MRPVAGLLADAEVPKGMVLSAMEVSKRVNRKSLRASYTDKAQA
jgi:hypothetical protein